LRGCSCQKMLLVPQEFIADGFAREQRTRSLVSLGPLRRLGSLVLRAEARRHPECPETVEGRRGRGEGRGLGGGTGSGTVRLPAGGNATEPAAGHPQGTAEERLCHRRPKAPERLVRSCHAYQLSRRRSICGEPSGTRRHSTPCPCAVCFLASQVNSLRCLGRKAVLLALQAGLSPEGTEDPEGPEGPEGQGGEAPQEFKRRRTDTPAKGERPG